MMAKIFTGLCVGVVGTVGYFSYKVGRVYTTSLVKEINAVHVENSLSNIEKERAAAVETLQS